MDDSSSTHEILKGIRVVRYRMTEGARVAMLVDEGEGELFIVIMDESGLRRSRLQHDEARYLEVLDYEPVKAAERFLGFGETFGISAELRDWMTALREGVASQVARRDHQEAA